MNLLRLVVGSCVATVALAHGSRSAGGEAAPSPSNRKPFGWDASQKVTWDYGLSVEVTDFNWDEKVADFGSSPVFLHFFAPWDMGCKGAAPQWKEFGDVVNAPDSKHEFIAGHVNIVENTDLASWFNITKFPMYKLMHKDQMYLFNDTKSTVSQENLLSFGNGGWRSASHRTIGGSFVMDTILEAIESAQDLLINHTQGAAPILAAGVLGGFLSGLVLGRMVFGCAGSRKKKSSKIKKTN